MTNTENLVKGRKVRYLGAFNPHGSIIAFQEFNFNPAEFMFDGPDIIAFNSIEQAKNWFRMQLDQLWVYGQEASMFLHPVVNDELYIELNSEPIKLFERGARYGVRVWDC